jgi:NCAIR mutase (PurE)-related protein
MNRRALEDLLGRLRRGEVEVETALAALRDLPFSDLTFAKPDHHRELRTGHPEVVYGEGKTAEQIAAIAERLALHGQNVLVTRLDAERAAALGRLVAGVRYHAEARLAVHQVAPVPVTGKGTVLVVSAGTSDQAVAEEAALTAELAGNAVARLYDVGVAGIHRVLESRGRLAEARVLVVVAGMEGALPSVVGGLTERPVIAVPTSVGYGASFGGVAALLGMLTTCAPGVTVVNIDNGFGAAIAASRINHL